MFAFIEFELVFKAVNEAMFPYPESAKPIDGVLFCQKYVVFGFVAFEKIIAAVKLPLQMV